MHYVVRCLFPRRNLFYDSGRGAPEWAGFRCGEGTPVSENTIAFPTVTAVDWT